MDAVSVRPDAFDAGAEIAALSAGREGVGAVASFVGTVRGEGVLAMTLEHYPGMTERALHRIVEDARTRWPLASVRVIHRVGRLLPGEAIVFVGVASAHRHAAFEACAFIMDFLKTRAPFWKKEETAAGARWVDARDSDDTAAARWASPGSET
ncbi:molybdopterin synthase catalytic subunit MoaE [Uliginosibacterium sp. H1]|uniref:molybdopterin synthase catalytic subunit MoaE n=1 Tax=Uliginosibacterium sp. H1 TaxID=3114757 RepID=UPI002E197592|nr:molybdopterin synthase catalytic subunit MoaE [Uliginosibacterium sp. H1]